MVFTFVSEFRLLLMVIVFQSRSYFSPSQHTCLSWTSFLSSLSDFHSASAVAAPWLISFCLPLRSPRPTQVITMSAKRLLTPRSATVTGSQCAASWLVNTQRHDSRTPCSVFFFPPPTAGICSVTASSLRPQDKPLEQADQSGPTQSSRCLGAVVVEEGGVSSVFSLFCPTLLALGDFSCDVNAPAERKSVSPAFVMIASFRFTAACVVSLPARRLAAVCQWLMGCWSK